MMTKKLDTNTYRCLGILPSCS